MKKLPIKLDLALNDIHWIGNRLILGVPPDTETLRFAGGYLKKMVQEIRNELYEY